MDTQAITVLDIAIRLFLGFIAGGILGFERSSRHQVAGLRTHILISLGATLLMLLSIWIPQEVSGFGNADPGRIAAQVVSGIGFLGAGAIIRLGNNVRGLTTAASLWFAAAVGLAIGAGMFIAAAIAETTGFITLFLLNKLEKKIFPVERLKILEIIYKQSKPDTETVMQIIKSAKIRLQTVNIAHGSKNKRTRLRLLVSIPSSIDITRIAHEIKDLEGVVRVIIQEN